MKKLLLISSVVLALGFLAACPSEPLPGGVSGGGNGGPPSRVVQPVIEMTPDRYFNTDDITINFTSGTPETIFFYTLSGAIPTSASLPFEGPFPLRIADAGEGDLVELRVIGTRAGFDASPITSLMFRIAERRRHGTFEETRIGQGFGTGYVGGITRVRLTLVGGFITDVEIETGYNSSSPETYYPEEGMVFWPPAYDHAREFMMVMSCVEFDLLTGATGSSNSIREGARQALANILAQ